jgi:hypothetical protein
MSGIRTPEQIAAEIVSKYPNGSNNFIAKAIADAIAADRVVVRNATIARCAAIADVHQLRDRRRWKNETDWRQPYASNRVLRASLDIAAEIRALEDKSQ